MNEPKRGDVSILGGPTCFWRGVGGAHKTLRRTTTTEYTWTYWHKNSFLSSKLTRSARRELHGSLVPSARHWFASVSTCDVTKSRFPVRGIRCASSCSPRSTTGHLRRQKNKNGEGNCTREIRRLFLIYNFSSDSSIEVWQACGRKLKLLLLLIPELSASVVDMPHTPHFLLKTSLVGTTFCACISTIQLEGRPRCPR